LLNNSFLSKELTKKIYTIPISKRRSIRVNLAQKLYNQIYNARNSYMHGNPITMKDITAWGETKRHRLDMFAPLLFKIALITRIGINYDDVLFHT
ncbi:unnamed protein product, partial [marine sediment metagenome]